MMGALEALDGMMLFGQTTAFLFSVLRHRPAHGGRAGEARLSPLSGAPRRRKTKII